MYSFWSFRVMYCKLCTLVAGKILEMTSEDSTMQKNPKEVISVPWEQLVEP